MSFQNINFFKFFIKYKMDYLCFLKSGKSNAALKHKFKKKKTKPILKYNNRPALFHIKNKNKTYYTQVSGLKNLRLESYIFYIVRGRL